MDYDKLAEGIITAGINSDQLAKVARFKPGFDFELLEKEMKRDYQPPFTTEAMIAQTSKRLEGMLELIT